MTENYDIYFNCGYRIVIKADNLEDAITLAKGEAIRKGYKNPVVSKTVFGESKVNPAVPKSA